MSTFLVALVQTAPGEDKDANLEAAFRQIDRAAAAGADAVLLPESFHVRGPNALRFATAEPVPGPLSQRLAAAAARHGVVLLGGSFNTLTDDPERLANTSLLFGPGGTQIARYDKTHLFDVEIEGRVIARESSRNRPGDALVVADTPLGPWGMTICFDVRFPELYRSLALRGAETFLVPSNFATHTGKDHWEPLLRARAIENGAWVLAPATCGSTGDFHAYGRSLAVDPWGVVVAQAPDQEGFTLVSVDRERVREVRAQIPSLSARRPELYDL